MATATNEVPRMILRIMRERERIHADILHRSILVARRRYDLPTPPYETEDLLQVMRGITAVMEESINGTGISIRSGYLESSAEGLARSGVVPFPYQACVVAGSTAGVIADIAPLLPEADRPAAVDWFVDFFGDYMSDLIESGLRFS